MELLIKKYFSELETDQEYKGNFFNIRAAVTITILGTFCGLKDMQRIHQWATNERIVAFLNKNFGILKIPCYSWFTQILGLIDPKRFSECFTNWVINYWELDLKGKVLSLYGKTVRSTAKMKAYNNPLHIVSAQIANLGITLGQEAVESKSNEIPAVRRLLEFLNIEGCLIVADALNCQKETVKTIVENGGDYLLSVKDNQKELKNEIADFVQDDDLRKTMDCAAKKELSRNRIETRTAYTTWDIDWIFGKEEWTDLACIGAINTQFETENGKSNEWHYYISNRKLSAQDLLDFARLEWSVETMHWLLDVHFGEDFCRAIDQNIQENLNIIRKMVLNIITEYKNTTNSKQPFSQIMFDCLMNPEKILFIMENYAKN